MDGREAGGERRRKNARRGHEENVMVGGGK